MNRSSLISRALTFSIGGVRKNVESLAVAVFVDGKWMHGWNFCHRISSRSFFVRGRQFHICARCTGIVCGYFLSPSLFAIEFFSGVSMIALFPFFFAAMAADGLSQLAGLRESNNFLRFATGLGFGISMPIFLFDMVRMLFLL